MDNLVTFTEGDDIECKAGLGTVTYCEDGFMEVRLRDRTERTFKAPFDGKVWRYVKPVPVSELPVWTTIMSHERVVARLGSLHQFHALASMAARAAGGRVSRWDELSDFQKVNFLGVSSGCPAPFWKDAADNGTLDQLAAAWLK
jgi:hypothetical protein